MATQGERRNQPNLIPSTKGNKRQSNPTTTIMVILKDFAMTSTVKDLKDLEGPRSVPRLMQEGNRYLRQVQVEDQVRWSEKGIILSDQAE